MLRRTFLGSLVGLLGWTGWAKAKPISIPESEYGFWSSLKRDRDTLTLSGWYKCAAYEDGIDPHVLAPDLYGAWKLQRMTQQTTSDGRVEWEATYIPTNRSAWYADKNSLNFSGAFDKAS